MVLSNSFLTDQLKHVERELALSQTNVARATARMNELLGMMKMLNELIEIEKKALDAGPETASEERSGPGPGEEGGQQPSDSKKKRSRGSKSGAVDT